MCSDTAGVRKRPAPGVLGAGVLLLLLATTACAPALIAGGTLATGVGVAALTSHCYDYLEVSVLDPEGRRTCAATVTATNRGDRFELTSCYHAPLTDGRWKLRASMPGYSDAVSTVEVEHANDCTRHVLTVELTLKKAGNTVPQAPALTSSTAPPSAPPASPSAPPASTSAPSPGASPPAAPTLTSPTPSPPAFVPTDAGSSLAPGAAPRSRVATRVNLPDGGDRP